MNVSLLHVINQVTIIKGREEGGGEGKGRWEGRGRWGRERGREEAGGGGKRELKMLGVTYCIVLNMYSYRSSNIQT